MCGFYNDGTKIKSGDIAIYNGDEITICQATHIKETKTMDIVYKTINKDKKNKLNFPYKTITTMKLIKRMDKNQ